jgi:hypothetical protein
LLEAFPGDILAVAQVLDDVEHRFLLRSGMLLTPRAPSAAAKGASQAGFAVFEDTLHDIPYLVRFVANPDELRQLAAEEAINIDMDEDNPTCERDSSTQSAHQGNDVRSTSSIGISGRPSGPDSLLFISKA